MPWKCVGLVLNIDLVRCVFFNWVTFNFVNCGNQKQNLVHVNPSPDNKLFNWSNLRITDWLPKLVFQQLKTFVLINFFLWSLMTYLQGKRNLLIIELIYFKSMSNNHGYDVGKIHLLSKQVSEGIDKVFIAMYYAITK